MRLLAIVPLLLLAPPVVRPAAAAGAPLAVIVHPSRADRLGTADVARIFLRRQRFWRDGSPIVPLNREPGSDARETFSRSVLGGDSARWASYWNDAYFNGVFPPAVLSSSAAVKRYVASQPGAIGYVDPADVDDTVRVALRIDASDGEPPRR